MSEGTKQRKGGTSHGEVPLFAMAAHELKSPLALIRQLSMALEADATSENSLDVHQVQQLARRIQLTSERALRLTGDVTQSQRLNPSLFPLEPIDVLGLCYEVADELSPLYTARERELRVRQRSQQSAPVAVGNRELLRRVLLQFADNALHYAPSKMPVELKVRASRNGLVQVGVRDYGPGLARRVWRSGQSSRVTVPRRPSSSGLGLLIAEQFAELMNGQIGVTRHQDGASFYITLQGSTQMRLL